MTKKQSIFLISIILSICLSIFLVGFINQNTDKAFANDESYGINLEEGKKVRIEYSYYSLRNEIYIAYAVAFDIDYFGTLGESGNEYIEILSNIFKNTPLTVNRDTSNGQIVASHSFSPLEEYYVENGITGYDLKSRNPDNKKVNGLFEDSVYIEKTVFQYLNTENTYINKIYLEILGFGISDEEISLVYIYGTPYNENTFSSSANDVSYMTMNNVYLHSFKMNVNEADKEITFKYHLPYTVGWYLIALAIAIIVLGVFLTIYIIKRKKENDNGSK